MKELPEVLMLKVLDNLNKKDVMRFFICSKEEDVKREYLKNTKKYLLKTSEIKEYLKDEGKEYLEIEKERLDKAKLFFKLVKSSYITLEEIVKIINGFTLDNGASKVQVLKALASNKELFETLSLEHKEKIVDFVIFPMGMSRQEEENNKPEVERNQKEIAEILGIQRSNICGASAVNIVCNLECVIS